MAVRYRIEVDKHTLSADVTCVSALSENIITSSERRDMVGLNTITSVKLEIDSDMYLV